MATRDRRWHAVPLRTVFLRVGILFLGACGADQAVAAGDPFRTHVDAMSIAPSEKPRIGDTVIITCRWSAKFHEHGANKDKTVFEIAPAPPTHVFGDFFVKYQAGANAGVSKSFDSAVKPGYYTKDQPLKGEFKLTWIPLETGAALATCAVHGPHDPWQQHSKLQLPFWVNPPKHEIGGAADSPAAASAAFVTPPASVSIEGATGTPTGNCTGTLPRPVAVIKLHLRNSGKAIPASRGIASAKCCSGLLANPGVYLPAIGSGQTVIVDVPVGFTQSIPDGPGYLAKAPKTFSILVKPTNADGFAAPKAHLLAVAFPPGTCNKPSRAVVPGNNAGRRDP